MYDIFSKLKNDYSPQYVLVIDEDSYYPDSGDLDQGLYQEKITESNTSATVPCKIDPFRQAAGKLWTVRKQTGADFNSLRFYDPHPFAGYGFGGNTISNPSSKTLFVPGTYDIKGAGNYPVPSVKAYDVSDKWESLFNKGSYAESLNLKRKATRIVIKYESDDYLQNRLTLLSLVSDIAKKNQTKAYISTETPTAPDPEDFGQDVDTELALEELENLGIELVKVEAIISQNKDYETQGNWYSYNPPDDEVFQISNYASDPVVQKLSGKYGSEANWIEDNWILYVSNLFSPENKYLETIGYLDSIMVPFIFELIAKYEDSVLVPNDQKGLGFVIEEFLQWLFSEYKVSLELKIDSLEALLDQFNGGTAAYNLALDEYILKTSFFLSFPPGGNYNYYATLDKEQITLPSLASLGNEASALGDIPQGEILENATNTVEPLIVGFTNNAIRESRLNSFYDYYDNDKLQAGAIYEDSLQSRYYRDTAFQMPVPMSLKAKSLTSENESDGSTYIEIKPTYNFYSRYYEEATKRNFVDNSSGGQTAVSEVTFPLIYEVPLEEQEDAPPSEGNPAVLPDSSKFSFEKFGHNLLNCKLPLDSILDESNFNIIIDQTDKAFLNKFESIKGQFPFYVDIDFKVDQNRDFATLFNNTGLSRPILDTFISNFFYVRKRGSQYTEPRKQDPIRDASGPDSYKYWNGLDTNPEFAELSPETAPICSQGIYEIHSKKEIYSTVSPKTTALSGIIENNIYDTSPEYNVREFDLNEWLNAFILTTTGQLGSPVNTLELIFGTTVASEASKLIKSESSELIQPSSPSLISFVSQYQTLVQQKMRGYDEILNKNRAYNETLFYRIQKTAIDSEGNIDQGGLVQNIWMVNPNNSQSQNPEDIMRYIDTQVKYGQRYQYRVYAYQLVVGTKYGFQFENFLSEDPKPEEGTGPQLVTSAFGEYLKSVLQTVNDEDFLGYSAVISEAPIYSSSKPLDDGETSIRNVFFKGNGGNPATLATFDVVCEPDVKLIEMPVYEKILSVSDAPPVSPEVDIVPLRGKDNDIKINFFPGSVSREMLPLALTPDDAAKFDRVRKAQERDLFKQEYAQQYEQLFAAMHLQDTNIDLPPGFPPYVYAEPRLKFKSDDFVTHYEIYKLDTPPKSYYDFVDNKFETINAQEQSSYTDKIEQNVKYYYMFRSIDVHENISNPSPVYQVEMVENSGAVYPIISIYNFEQENSSAKSKPFKRYLKIDASALQTAVDLKASNLENTNSAIVNDGVSLGPNNSQKIFSATHVENHKKFKFRIKSKHTGKVVDLNVAFKTRLNQVNENAPTCGEDGFVENNLPEAGSEVMHEGAGTDNSANEEGHSW